MFVNTIDLDYCTKEDLEKIIEKIRLNPCCKDLQVKPSFSKGYHLRLECKINCDVCRLVFDDTKRLSMDEQRDLKFQNTLFDSKEYRRGNLKKLSKKCDNCALKGINTNLIEKELTMDETEKKLKELKCSAPYKKMGHIIKSLQLAFVIGYTFYECPVCKWGKFVNRTKAELER